MAGRFLSNEKGVTGAPVTLDLLFLLYQFCPTHTDTIFEFILVADSLGCEKNVTKGGLTAFWGVVEFFMARVDAHKCTYKFPRLWRYLLAAIQVFIFASSTSSGSGP